MENKNFHFFDYHLSSKWDRCQKFSLRSHFENRKKENDPAVKTERKRVSEKTGHVVSVIDTENRITMETIAKLGERVRCSGKVFHFLEGRGRKLVRLSTNRMALSGASTRGRTRVSKTIHINVFPLQGYMALPQREQG